MQIEYLTGDREEPFIIAQANAQVDEKGVITQLKK